MVKNILALIGLGTLLYHGHKAYSKWQRERAMEEAMAAVKAAEKFRTAAGE